MWRYFSISSDFQRPRSLILLESMPSHSMAIAPVARRDRAEMSSGLNPHSGQALTAWRNRSVTISEVTTNQLPPSANAQRGVSGEALFARRWQI